MNRRAIAGTRLSLIAAGLLVLPATFRAQTPVFRTSVEGVTVSVAVRQGRQPITGLGAGDFRLLDNGVPQAIQAVSVETLPIDVTLLLDLSASVEGARLERLKSAVKETAKLMRPTDRLRLLSVQHVLHEVFPFQPGGGAPQVETLTAQGGTALFDGLAGALMRASDPDRRQLIVAYTDGQDTISILPAESVRGVAGHSDAVINVVVPNASGGSARSNSGLTSLTELATHTGGQLFTVDSAASIGASFTRAIEEFRTSYVLRYVPAGVTRQGWHEVTVQVPGRPFEIRARRGYAIN